MSSRVLKGEAAEAAGWRAVDSGQSVQALARSGGRVLPRAAADGGAGGAAAAEAAAWERKLRALEAEVQAQARAAYERGRAEAEAAARAEAHAALAPAREAFGRLVEELAALRGRLRREAEYDVVKLAVAIAARVLRRELTADPEALLGVVKAAVERLNAREVHRLRVSAGDRERIAAHVTELGLPPAVEVTGDRSLPPGSVVFETVRGHYDASVDTQLAEIERGFADRLGLR